MYLNVSINGRSNLKIAAVSVAELRAIQTDVREKAGSVDYVLEEVTLEGDYQVARVSAEGDRQLDLVELTGAEQVAEVISEGTTQVVRVILAGDSQVDRAATEADRAETEADRATTQADEIKAVGVAIPVTSIPLLPGNTPGVPTVTYDSLTGLFTYGIPIGKTGSPAQVITPVGGATVAELNALVADPILGSAYWMEDAGTITYGSQPTVVTLNEVVVWVEDGYFFNVGEMVSGTRWDKTTGVTVNGFAPVDGDDLLPTIGGTMSGKLVMANDIAIEALNSSGTPVPMLNMTVLNEMSMGSATTPVLAQGIWEFKNVAPSSDNAPTENKNLTRKDYVDTELNKKEDYLEVPLEDGMVLSSLLDGTRSWITSSGGSGGNLDGGVADTDFSAGDITIDGGGAEDGN